MDCLANYWGTIIQNLHHDHTAPCGKCNKRHCRIENTAVATGGITLNDLTPAIGQPTGRSRHQSIFCKSSLILFLGLFTLVSCSHVSERDNPSDLAVEPRGVYFVVYAHVDNSSVHVKEHRRGLQVLDHDHETEGSVEVEGQQHYQSDETKFNEVVTTSVFKNSSFLDGEMESNFHDHEKETEDNDHQDDRVHSSEIHESTLGTSEIPKPWGQVILATLLVDLASLSGLLLLVIPALHIVVLKLRGIERSTISRKCDGKFINICIPAFAVGALMATTVFLVFPEGLHLIGGTHSENSNDVHSNHVERYLQGDDHIEHADEENESLSAAKFGCSVLGGYFLPVLLSIFFHHSDGDDADSAVLQSIEEQDCVSCEANDVETGIVVDNDTIKPSLGKPLSSTLRQNDDSLGETSRDIPLEPLQTKDVINYSLGASILIGDAFHNFADGLFIGAAFLSCSWSTALSITIVSIFHELAQELADFILLTRYVGLSVFKACVFNFVSGFSVCLGGLTILAAKPSDEIVGVILSMAGGVYIYIAASETVPRLENFVENRWDRVFIFVSIVVGTVPIGLVLLNHKHCG